ncbi:MULTISPECIES: hypothetical protein [unclassified Bradyrhizobium]|uniref:hypothetical protein n=1 Tax=unclassified Bradyrhizobium TaxID=2631580 RepID=UPI0033948C9F
METPAISIKINNLGDVHCVRDAASSSVESQLEPNVGIVGCASAICTAKKTKKAAAAQKEMLMPIAGKMPAKEAAAKKPTSGTRRKSA